VLLALPLFSHAQTPYPLIVKGCNGSIRTGILQVKCPYCCQYEQGGVDIYHSCNSPECNNGVPGMCPVCVKIKQDVSGHPTWYHLRILSTGEILTITSFTTSTDVDGGTLIDFVLDP
jgi:hypothetical protein